MDCFFQENLVLDDAYYQFHYQAIGEIIEEMGLAFLKEKVIQKSLDYMKYCASRHSLEAIRTNVHLVLSEMAQRLNWSGECWEKVTRGRVITYNGFGHHREVFDPVNIRKNGEILKEILEDLKKDLSEPFCNEC